MVSIVKKPGDPCFVADGVSYHLMIYGNDSDHKPRTLTFLLEIFDDHHRGMTTTNINVICIPTIGEQDEDNYVVDMADILESYTFRYAEVFGYIVGYATIRLTKINGTTVSLDPSKHYCLPGTSAGIKLGTNDVLPDNQHNFLVAHGSEKDSIHFYRSELLEMEYLYALVPNAYVDYCIKTDNAETNSQELGDKIKNIDGLYNLVRIWLTGDNGSQYEIQGDADILLLCMEYYDEYYNRIIAIDDDPNTDEIHLIRWTNSMGALEVLLLTGEMQDVSEVSDPELYISSQNLERTIRKQKRRTTTTKYNLQTGFLTQGRINALCDMLNSDEVELKIGSEWIPVSVTADTNHAVHQREPENFELTIEVLKQTRYRKPNRTVTPGPSINAILRDKSNKAITDNNSNIIY